MDKAIKHVFVTGATGNVGQAVMAELQRRDIDITILSRKAVKNSPYKVLKGNLKYVYAHASEIEKADAVLHLASSRANDPRSVYELNAFGTLQLLRAWSHGPFLYPCSQGIYGIPDAPLVEESPISPTYWFDIGHILNEMQLRVESKRRNIGPAISLRLSLLFPTGTRPDDQFFNKTLHQCLSNSTFLVDSEAGLTTYGTSFLGSGDLGRACVDALSLKDSGPYNVAGGFCTWSELIEMVNLMAGTKAQIKVRSDPTPKNKREVRLPQSRSLIVDKKFRAATGFAHRDTLEQLVDNWLRVTLSAKSSKR